jgi:DnaJ-domain-containing protein 1
VPSDIDYFTYLGIPTKFNLDELELKQLFRRKQAKVHPDRFTQKSAQEVDLAIKGNSIKISCFSNFIPKIIPHI